MQAYRGYLQQEVEQRLLHCHVSNLLDLQHAQLDKLTLEPPYDQRLGISITCSSWGCRWGATDLGGPHVRVGRPTYCFHVGPTKLLEGAEVSWSVGQVGPHQRWVGRPTLGGRGLAHHLDPHVVPTCHLQSFVDVRWFWFLIIFASFELDQA